MIEAYRSLRSRHSRGAIVLVCVVVLLLASAPGVVSGLLIKSGIDSSRAAQAKRLYTVQVQACRRQNVRQATVNLNALATWRLNTLFAQAVAHPVVPPVRPRSLKERKLEADFAGRLDATVNSLTWTALNHDCAGDPTAVQLPVRFSQRPPVKADLP